MRSGLPTLPHFMQRELLKFWFEQPEDVQPTEPQFLHLYTSPPV